MYILILSRAASAQRSAHRPILAPQLLQIGFELARIVLILPQRGGEFLHLLPVQISSRRCAVADQRSPRKSFPGISMLILSFRSSYTKLATFDPPKCSCFAVFYLGAVSGSTAPISPAGENPKPGSFLFLMILHILFRPIGPGLPDFAVSWPACYSVPPLERADPQYHGKLRAWRTRQQRYIALGETPAGRLAFVVFRRLSGGLVRVDLRK